MNLWPDPDRGHESCGGVVAHVIMGMAMAMSIAVAGITSVAFLRVVARESLSFYSPSG